MILESNNDQLSWDSDILSQAFFFSSIVDQSNQLNLEYGDSIKQFRIMKNSHSVVEEIYLMEQENLMKEFRRCENLVAKCRAGTRREILLEKLEDLRTELECFEISFRCWETLSKRELKKEWNVVEKAERYFLDMEKAIAKLWMCKHWEII